MARKCAGRLRSVPLLTNMERTLRDLQEEQLEAVGAIAPYTCLHYIIIRPHPNGEDFELHMLHEKAYVVHYLARGEPFKGHPFCHCCQQMQFRFLLGSCGNLIQAWSNAQFRIQDVHVANLYSEGQLMVRSVTQFPANMADLLQPRATATLVQNIEKHIWKREHFPATGGPRKLILGHAPFKQHIFEVKEAMQEAVERLKPFIYLLVADLYIKFLPDESDDEGRVRLAWTPITANPEDQTNFGVMTVQEDLTLEDFMSRFVRNPSLTVYSLTNHGSIIARNTWPGFARETLRELYYQVQQDLGNGTMPYALFPDGTLKYPIFQVHLAPERFLPLRWAA